MQCVISETEVYYLIDLLRQIKEDTANIDDTYDEIDNAEELLEGLLIRSELEIKSLMKELTGNNNNE